MITKNKFLFRFLMIFFGLWIIPFPINLMPFLSDITVWLNQTLESFYLWVGNSVYGIETKVPISRGSGDSRLDYVIVLTNFILAIIGSTIWTFAKKKDRNYKDLNYWFWSYLRFYLAAQMLVYGLMKVFPLQMSTPTFSRLIQPFGDFSPMGLAWSYVGFSPGYEMFVGASEFIAGLLLLHRRTSLLGGIVSIIVMANVAAINFFFDVPVKIFSSILVVISIIVVSPQIRRLFQLMFGNKPVLPLPIFCPITTRKSKIAKELVKWTLVLSFIFYRINVSYESLYSDYGPFRAKTPLYGLYEIEKFKLNGEERPPLITDASRWRYIISEYPGRMTIYNMENDAKWIGAKVDSIKQDVELQIRSDTVNKHRFNYIKTDSTLIGKGTFRGDSIYFEAKRLYKKDFLLMNRGFNWVQEYPFNR